MIFNSPVNKSTLEELIQQSFDQFGTVFASNLIDSLKNLGFHYSTTSGISLNIEDLKVSPSKGYLLDNASLEIKEIEKAWRNGNISNAEKFKAIVNKWEILSEILKDKLILYYKTYDPTNSLYLMAFSGARGNISQVRQIVGMRGLMVNQKGSIIQLPILSNFREGLTNIDYIISSYGARKGIIDTALRTADAGYLTRRLIFLMQEVIIRDINCNSQKSLKIKLERNSFDSLLGRSLVSIKPKRKDYFFLNIVINSKILQFLKKTSDIIDFIQVRSPLTCTTPNSLCQYCYGWDLSKKKLISLGDTIGIIAAQSIGEPGTQLTMRTFHTGGIFIGQTKTYFSSPFSGKIYLSNNFSKETYYSKYGIYNTFLNRKNYFSILNWKNKISKIQLKKGEFFYNPKLNFFKKGDIIKEKNIGLLNFLALSQNFLKPVYSSVEGIYKYSKNFKIFPFFQKNLLPETKPEKYENYYLVSCEGKVVQFPRKIFEFPVETKIQSFEKKKRNKFQNLNSNLLYTKNFFFKHKSIGKIKIVAPANGVCFYKDGYYILNTTKIFSVTKFQKIFKKHYFINLSTLFSNYQYVDRNTVLGLLYLFPKQANFF